MAAAELLELFKKAQGAAEKANSGEDAAEEARCVEALQAMRGFPVTTALLQSTQVGRQVRLLTKHSEAKVRETAALVLEDWKKRVSSEATSKKQANVKQKAVSKSNENDNNTTNMKQKAVPEANKASTKLKVLPKCNDAARDKIRENLLEAFSKVPEEAGPDYSQANDPIQAAVDVETALYKQLGPIKADKKGKYRSILFNLRDAKNPDLRRRVFTGEINPAQLTTMSAEDMASDRRRAENKQIKDKALFECERGMKQEATTNEFKCGKCGKRECTYYQKQIRSADEPMTTFVTCVNCNHRWKFC